jgi:hypothetical protein
LLHKLSLNNMPVVNTKGAASSQGFGEFAKSGPTTYIEDVFSTYLYTGTGAARTITNGIDLSTKGGLVWTACRSNAYGQIRQTAPGTYLDQTTAAAAADSSGNFITAFNSTGFTIGDGTVINNSGSTFASWTFRKQPKFFDIVTYTGDANPARTISHNLGSVPGCIIVKETSGVRDWAVYHTSTGNTQYLTLNSTSGAGTQSFWNNTSPTSTVFSVNGDWNAVNGSGRTYVAYLFASNAGGFGAAGTDNVITCGSFTTDGSGNATVSLGYEPQWILYKPSSSVGNWTMADNLREWSNTSISRLFADSSSSEAVYTANTPNTPNATGFQFTGLLNSSSTYIYIAIRRGPMKTPTDGTSVFAPVTYTGTGAAQNIVGPSLPTDLFIGTKNQAASNRNFFDRLRGAGQYIRSDTTLSEQTDANTLSSFAVINGVSLGTATMLNQSAVPYIGYFMRRAPGFFDVVCYTGTGSATTQTHNLGVVPELMIIKSRSTLANWPVYAAPLGNSKNLLLNATFAEASTTSLWNSTTPTTSVFSLGTGNASNQSGSTFVAYLFATLAGVSKVGTYTGNGTTQTINCGFTGGARFVLIKRTDSTGDWYTYDTARGMTTLTDPYLLINSTAAETATLGSVTTVTTGFALNAAILADINTSAATYIFLAIA